MISSDVTAVDPLNDRSMNLRPCVVSIPRCVQSRWHWRSWMGQKAISTVGLSAVRRALCIRPGCWLSSIEPSPTPTDRIGISWAHTPEHPLGVERDLIIH